MPSELPSTEPSEAPSAAATPTASQTAGGFQIAAHPAADSLFLDRDECENEADGYRLEFPDAWYTNTAVGGFEPCQWFSPDFYEVDDPSQVPAAIGITIEVVPRDNYTGGSDPNIDAEGIIGGTQDAMRVDGGDEYTYLVRLGPPGEGPTLIARTSTDMGGDYELNKAVLDRIMATMEFIGTTQ